MDLHAGSYSEYRERREREENGVGSRRHADGVLDPEIGGSRLLESLGGRTEDVRRRSQHVENGRLELVRNLRVFPTQVEKRNSLRLGAHFTSRFRSTARIVRNKIATSSRNDHRSM